jgi:hypothetical protein
MNAAESEAVDLVRSRRVELVDDAGRVRAILGNLGGEEERALFGLALVDDNGRQRVWLSLDENGPALAFDQSGNTAIHLGVNDAAPDATHVGAVLHLCDARGNPALSWRVEDDGSVTMRASES